MWTFAGKTATSSAMSPHPARRRVRGMQHAEPAEDLANTADDDEQRCIGEPRRHDRRVQRGHHEVHGAAEAEEEREQRARPRNAEPA